MVRVDFQAAVGRGSAFSCRRLLFGRSSVAGEDRVGVHIHVYSRARVYR